MPGKNSTYVENVHPHPSPRPPPHTTAQRMLINVILRTGLEDSRKFIHFWVCRKLRQNKGTSDVMKAFVRK